MLYDYFGANHTINKDKPLEIAIIQPIVKKLKIVMNIEINNFKQPYAKYNCHNILIHYKNRCSFSFPFLILLKEKKLFRTSKSRSIRSLCRHQLKIARWRPDFSCLSSLFIGMRFWCVCNIYWMGQKSFHIFVNVSVDSIHLFKELCSQPKLDIFRDV